MSVLPELCHRPYQGTWAAILCLGLLLGPALAGCQSSPTGSTAGSSGSTQPRTADSAASAGTTDGEVIEGAAFRFRLPRTPSFEASDEQTVEGGAIKRRWQHAITAGGPYCMVVAVEQPSYTQPFPGSVLAVFEALNAEKSDHIIRNTSIPPVAGAIGGVDQELEYTLRLDDGTTAPARMYQRQYLTPGKALVSVAASSPQDQAAACGISAVVASLEVTGRELTTPVATS
jgi:hypothetical protein